MGIWGAAEFILGFGEHKQNTFRELRQKISGIWGDQSIIFRELGSKDPPWGGHISYEMNIYHIATGTKQLLMSFYTFGNKVIKISISKFVFWTSRNMYFAQNETVKEEGFFWRKEDFHTKGTFCHIATGTKQLQYVIL